MDDKIAWKKYLTLGVLVLFFFKVVSLIKRKLQIPKRTQTQLILHIILLFCWFHINLRTKLESNQLAPSHKPKQKSYSYQNYCLHTCWNAAQIVFFFRKDQVRPGHQNGVLTRLLPPQTNTELIRTAVRGHLERVSSRVCIFFFHYLTQNFQTGASLS